MYNKKQSEAILSKEGEIVIVAPPGSGKTFTMVGAVEEFIKDGDNPWTVVITFTNNAADELKERLGFTSLEISTIHSWSYRELVSLSQQYGFRVRLLEEAQIKEIIKPYMRDYSVSQNSIDYVYQHVMGNVNPDLWQSLKRKYDAIKDRYIAYKRKMHLYDFTDLPLYLRHKLEEHNEYIILDGLFVDEFQDVDPDQLATFNRVKAKKKFFIGDLDQAIYVFRGATEEIFSELPGYTFHELDTNYRSYQEILNFAYDFKNQAPARVGEVSFTNTTSHGVKASRGKGAVIIHEKSGVAIRYEDGFEFMQNLEETVLNELNKHSYQFLCRTNREVRELQELGIHAASTIHKAKGLEYDNVAVIDFGIESDEDINVAFVALTRAKNRLMVISIRDYLKKSVKTAF